MNQRTLLKICLRVTYLTDFYIICIHFYYGKTWEYLIKNNNNNNKKKKKKKKKKTMSRINVFVHR